MNSLNRYSELTRRPSKLRYESAFTRDLSPSRRRQRDVATRWNPSSSRRRLQCHGTKRGKQWAGGQAAEVPYRVWRKQKSQEEAQSKPWYVQHVNGLEQLRRSSLKHLLTLERVPAACVYCRRSVSFALGLRTWKYSVYAPMRILFGRS